MKALLYCTKSKPYLYKNTTVVGENIFTFAPFIPNESDIINGKIVAECDFEVEEIIANDVNLYDEYGIKYTTKNGYSCIDDNFEALLDDSCLNAFELNDYLGGYGGYAINIENLHIFDKPKELSEYHISYYNKELKMQREKHIEKAPKNMCYVFDVNDKYVFISISPERLCKIFNGECTIIVKKTVLKEML